MLVNTSRMAEVLDQRGVELVVTTVPQSVTYLSGYDSEQIYNYDNVFAYMIWPRTGEPTLVVPAGELRHLSHRPPDVGSCRAYGTFYIELPQTIDGLAPEEAELARLLELNPVGRDAATVIAEIIAGLTLPHGARVALEHKGDKTAIAAAIQGVVPNAEIIGGAELIEEVRLVKTRSEVDRILRATRIAEEAFLRIAATVRVGMSDQQLYRTFLSTVAEYEGLPGFWTGGVGGRGMSAPASMGYPVSNGDLVRFDAGCTVGRYWSDVGRTIAIGKPTDRVRKYYDAIYAGYVTGLEHIGPGKSVDDVFEATVKAVRANGIPDYKRHHCGHGIGLYLYESPMIRNTAGTSDIYKSRGDGGGLIPGMVLNFEVPYYEIGIGGGMMIEDTILITEQGYELISNLDRLLWVTG